MAAVVASYRQNVHAYPSGGGDYEVVTANHGPRWGLVVASALLVDYVLTVSVSIASAAANIGSLVPFVATHKVEFAVGAIVILTALNLRGIRESGSFFAVPTYAFVARHPHHDRSGAPLGSSCSATSCARRAPDFELLEEGDHLSGLRAAVPGAAGVLLRQRGADRGRGDQQRRAGVPQAEVEERGHHAGC